MDGTRAASMVAEYYCKRLYGKPVQWAGPSVTNPDRLASTPPPLRKLAVLYPATDGDPTYKLSVDLLIDSVSGGVCGSPSDGVRGYPYQSDINTATQQALTTAAAIKNDGATTVVCFCDPIAPAFFTAALDAQLYEPEHLIAGIGLIDYDLLGRLYTPGQWQHAFGLSELALSEPFDESERGPGMAGRRPPGLARRPDVERVVVVHVPDGQQLPDGRAAADAREHPRRVVRAPRSGRLGGIGRRPTAHARQVRRNR